jgi:hypothetical protein
MPSGRSFVTCLVLCAACMGTKDRGAMPDAGRPSQGADAGEAPPPRGASAESRSTKDDDTGDQGAAQSVTPCPATQPGVARGTLAHAALDEASGLVASRINPGVLWLHNDSGDSARLFAVNPDGSDAGVVRVSGAEAVDWEDIAIGPGPRAGVSYLYIADIGDNSAVRKSVQIYRIAEPKLRGGPTMDAAADRIDVTYADGAHDAETLLVDPQTSDLYIVVKDLSGGVYRIAAPGAGASSARAVKVGSSGQLAAVAGDVLPDGTGLFVRTYFGITYWPRDPARPLESAFAAEGCSQPLAAETQGESLGVAADGRGYYTVSEGASQPLHFYAF